MTWGEIPFGLRDAKITPWTAGGTLGTAVAVPRVRSVEANVTRDSADLDGDDVRIATHTFGTAIEGTFEEGGINFAVLAVINGGSSATTGVTPNRITTFILEGDDVDGYFKIEGQSYADDGGDTHVIIWRAHATNGPNHTFNQGEFTLTNFDYAGVFDQSTSPSRLYSIVQNETAVAIA
jgi:uncharacterized protein YqgV (UPF0045/DUF77 family)